MMATVLVTGADRGIGAALVRYYHARGERAIAACLEDGHELRRSNIDLVPNVDVTDLDSVMRLRETLGAVSLDIVISNAGAFHPDTFDAFDFDAMLRLYDINALGPLRVAHALVPMIKQGGKIGIITSRVGSIADNASGGMYGYRMSKCAANQLGVNLYHELKPRGIAVMLLHPGQVKTTMTRGLENLGNFVSPDEAARGLAAQLEALDGNTAPEFRHADGTLLPW